MMPNLIGLILINVCGFCPESSLLPFNSEICQPLPVYVTDLNLVTEQWPLSSASCDAERRLALIFNNPFSFQSGFTYLNFKGIFSLLKI